MTDLLTADNGVIGGWLRGNVSFGGYRALRDEIVRQARAAWERELVDAVYNAPTAHACECGAWTVARALELVSRRPSPPRPRSVTLSDGSVVTAGSYGVPGGQCWLFRETPTDGESYWKRKNVTLGQWPQLLRATDTGTDFDVVKQFAASVENK